MTQVVVGNRHIRDVEFDMGLAVSFQMFIEAIGKRLAEFIARINHNQRQIKHFFAGDAGLFLGK